MEAPGLSEPGHFSCPYPPTHVGGVQNFRKFVYGMLDRIVQHIARELPQFLAVPHKRVGELHKYPSPGQFHCLVPPPVGAIRPLGQDLVFLYPNVNTIVAQP